MSFFLDSVLQQTNFSNLRAFYACAHFGSRKIAAIKLGSAEPTLSNQISSLETELGVFLFERLSSGLKLTPAGRLLYQALSEMFHNLAEANRKIIALHQDKKIKVINIVTTIPLGAIYIPDIIDEFSAQYPLVEVRLNLTSEMPELASENIDIVLMPVRFDHPLFESLPVLEMAGYFYCSEDYLKEKGVPNTPSDLQFHDFIHLSSSHIQTELDLVSKFFKKERLSPKIRCSVNNSITAAELSERGLGICHYAKEMVAKQQLKLVQILPDTFSTQISVFATVHCTYLDNPLVITLLDIVRKHLK
jgi:DNA-binding transcriptional LysR family regulator